MLSVLDPLRIATYASTLASVVAGSDGSYFDALNRIQGRLPIRPDTIDRPQFVFNLDDQAKTFLNRVLAESQLSGITVERLSPECEQDAQVKIQEALCLLKSYHPEMPHSVRRLIGTLLFAYVENCASGSSADALGTVWVSPRSWWTAVRYAECLCHELVHQALFLEDMLVPVFQCVEDQPMMVSSIRRCKRPYESAFHSAVVAGALMEMYSAVGLFAQAEEFSAGLAESMEEFRAKPQHLTSRGLEVLEELFEIVSTRRSHVISMMR
jgi:HEXXH motif-containing protein